MTHKNLLFIRNNADETAISRGLVLLMGGIYGVRR
jgi:hypothetical protein